MKKRVIRTERETLEFLKQRRAAYQQVFGTPAGQMVLEDLAVFCRAGSSCFHADPRIHAALEGRREVWLRIDDHINLTSGELYDLFAGRPLLSRFESPLEDEDNG